MSSDELRAWLLLAGFRQRWRRVDSRYSHFNDCGHYTIVEFLTSGRVKVSTLKGKRKFIRRRTAQQYIQKCIESCHQ